jgi:Resolvase, N terminal domain
MDRPGLQRLLADITARRVDTVVVYKIDRLTRSLADFAKIVEILDARDASVRGKIAEGDITQAIVDGRQPRWLTADKLLEPSRLPLAWRDQRTVLGFAWGDPGSKFIDIAESRAANRAWRCPDRREPHRRQCGTGTSPDRDTTVPQRGVGGPRASLPTARPGWLPILAENPGFPGDEGEIWRETDCLLEGTGFELLVRGRCEGWLSRPFDAPGCLGRVGSRPSDPATAEPRA